MTQNDTTFLGAVQTHQVDGTTVILTCEGGLLEVKALANDCFRVRAKPDAAPFGTPFSYAVVKNDWKALHVTVSSEAERIVVALDGLACHVNKADAGVSFHAEGRALCADAAGSMAWQGDAPRLHKRLTSDEAIYGLGQRAFSLNLRGRRYALWNLDPVVYDRGDDPAYYSIPFYVAAAGDGRVYGLFFDNTHRGTVDVGDAETDRLSFSFEGGELRYYFFAGPTAAEVLARYTELTGRMHMPPVWALGYHQCRWSYYPEEKVREIALTFRKRRIPCDAIYLDIDYMDGFRCFTWDKERFPNMAGLIDDLHKQGFHVVVMIDPGIKVDESYEVDQSGLAEDIFIKDDTGQVAVGAVWPGPSHFPDFTNPKAREWWSRQYDLLFETLDIDGVWNDMNEPTVFATGGALSEAASGARGATLPDNVVHDWEGRGATHVEAHNVYGMLMTKASRAALERLRPGKRQLLITRATFAGGQRYASSWTGDNRSSWDHIRLSLSMCLNLGLSGMAFTGPDIGGFANAGGIGTDEGAPTGEMVTRWVQVGACLPFFRMHSALGTPDQEPWSYGPKHESIMRRYIELRYELLPYVYAAFAESARSGMPIVRPMFMECADCQDVEDQFILGEHLLVAPVMEEGAAMRSVILPPGVWYNLWTGERLSGGGSVDVHAPLDVLPLFVRAGAAIPMRPAMQCVDEYPVETLRLRVFAGDGTTTLYEDDGKGELDPAGWSTLTVHHTRSVLDITWDRHPDAEPTYKYIDITITGLPWMPGAAWVDGEEERIAAAWEGVVQIVRAPLFKSLRVTRG